MRTTVTVLLVLAAADLAGCGLLLLFVWLEHRRRRREAAATGASVPPRATSSFVLLALGGLLGILILYSLLIWIEEG